MTSDSTINFEQKPAIPKLEYIYKIVNSSHSPL
jgi:hypothetical protein